MEFIQIINTTSSEFKFFDLIRFKWDQSLPSDFWIDGKLISTATDIFYYSDF